jgi:preprotein translocase subunit SecD
MALTLIIVVMLLTVLGTQTLSPGKWHQQFKVVLGLDLSSGTEAVLQASTGKPGTAPGDSAMRQSAAILQSRVNGTGTTGAKVQQLGPDHITITVPGKDSQDVLQQIGETAQLRFRPVLLMSPAAAGAVRYGDASLVSAGTMRLFGKLACTPGNAGGPAGDTWKAAVGYSASAAQYDEVSTQIVSCDSSGDKYVLDKAVFEGTDVSPVNTGLVNGRWVVDLTLHGKAVSAFSALTEGQYNTYYRGALSGNLNDAALDSTAVVLDGNVVSAPETTVPIPSGQVRIDGGSAGWTQAQATQLANALKFGALPLRLTPLSVNSISATTGIDSLHAGVAAGIIGLGLVAGYQLFYYRGLGVAAVSGLLAASLLTFLAVVLLSRHQGFTLDLAGVAGLIVSLGITADSFIVFFERLRDEVRGGKPLRPAVEAGWRRARRTILVSDTVSLLGAVLLYNFAISDVQGFAYTLGLTTAIDILVVFLFTKPLVTLLARTKFFGGGHKWSGLDPARLGARTPWRSGALAPPVEASALTGVIPEINSR